MRFKKDMKINFGILKDTKIHIRARLFKVLLSHARDNTGFASSFYFKKKKKWLIIYKINIL